MREQIKPSKKGEEIKHTHLLYTLNRIINVGLQWRTNGFWGRGEGRIIELLYSVVHILVIILTDGRIFWRRLDYITNVCRTQRLLKDGCFFSFTKSNK